MIIYFIVLSGWLEAKNTDIVRNDSEIYIKASNIDIKNGNIKKSDKITISLSLDRKVVDSLRVDAKEEGMSLNSYINNILSKWDTFFKYHRENQVITLTSRNFHTILEIIDEKTLVEMWNENALNLVSSIFKSRNIPVTLDNLLKYEYIPFGIQGGPFRKIKVLRDPEGRTNVIFIHQYGEKWSRIIETAISYQLQMHLKSPLKSSRTPSSVTITFLDKSVESNLEF